jgi:ABC-type branched-subunit amino acid transport system permease subunit
VNGRCDKLGDNVMLGYFIYFLGGLIWGWRSGEVTATAFGKVALVAVGIVAILTALRAAVPPGLPPFLLFGAVLVIAATLISASTGYLIGALARRTRMKNDAADNGQT